MKEKQLITVKAPDVERLDGYWTEFFGYIYMLAALGVLEIDIPEITFEAETVANPNIFEKIVRGKDKQVFVTMTEHSPHRILFNDDEVAIFTTENESKKLTALRLDPEIVNMRYMMSIFPQRHRIGTHIGNLRTVTFAIA